MEQEAQNLEPKTGHLYTGKAPVVLQLIGGLMWLNGLGMIFSGIFLLLFFGLGVALMVLGFFNIKYAKAIFKMQRRAYKGTIVVQVVSLVLSVILWGVVGNGFKEMNWSHFFAVVVAAVSIFAVFISREKFVN